VRILLSAGQRRFSAPTAENVSERILIQTAGICNSVSCNQEPSFKRPQTESLSLYSARPFRPGCVCCVYQASNSRPVVFAKAAISCRLSIFEPPNARSPCRWPINQRQVAQGFDWQSLWGITAPCDVWDLTCGRGLAMLIDHLTDCFGWPLSGQQDEMDPVFALVLAASTMTLSPLRSFFSAAITGTSGASEDKSFMEVFLARSFGEPTGRMNTCPYGLHSSWFRMTGPGARLPIETDGLVPSSQATTSWLWRTTTRL